jgi:hypothetical protein
MSCVERNGFKRLLAATSDEFRATLLGFKTDDEDED